MPSHHPALDRRTRHRTLTSAVLTAAVLAAASILLTACAAQPSSGPIGGGSVDTSTGRSAAATGATATGATATPGGTEAPDVSTTPAQAGTALALLATLPVKGRAPQTGYDRVGDFGEAWMDIDRNHCDTRDDVLARDLVDIVKDGSCKVTSGVLHDPYTGKTIHFVRGVRTSVAVQIDHLVALSDAWQTGAQQLTKQQRETLANDPIELLAVDGPTNEAKGDGDAATWLPPNRGFWCTYAARQVSVKAAYRLWVTPAEHDALNRILNGCPAQPAVSSTLAPTVGLG